MGKIDSKQDKHSWFLDQVSKSKFFHNKLHEWELLEISQEIDSIDGSKFKWDLKDLNITEKAWNKVIHSGIKPVRVFCHPHVLGQNPKRVRYYRMLAMVSQKSMSKLGLPVDGYESGNKEIPQDKAGEIARHLNKIISILIEYDEKVDAREFDLWRGMTAGSQAQGSWQNAKGSKAELLLREIVIKRISERKLLERWLSDRKEGILKDGRKLSIGSDPDIAFYQNNRICIAVEIKGGIDTAGVLERFGAALKSLGRVKQQNPNSKTVLIMSGVSLTDKAKSEISGSKEIDYFFVLEEIVDNEEIREQFFNVLGI